MPYRTLIEAMFQVVNRHGETVPFRLLPQQAYLDEQFSRRNIIPKGRQGAGISSYHIARYVAKCLGEKNRRCVIISHETDATARLLDRARFILNNLVTPEGMDRIKPVLGTDNMKAITFPKTNSSLWIGTAGSRNFGRGDTITDLLLSEAAQYADAESLTKGIFPAAEYGEISVESTGNGVGNWYHRQCVRAREGRGFRLFFFPSHEMADNQLPFLDNDARDEFLTHLDPELEEPQLLAQGLSPEFLRWRRERINVDFEGDLRTFHQEHPVEFDECFQSTGFSFFRDVSYGKVEVWERESHHFWALKSHPIPGVQYVIGGDVGAGVGKDNSVGQILRLDTLEQVGEWASDRHEPDAFGDVLAELGKRFNWAYINVERNNHGMTTIKQLIGKYPLALVHKGSHGANATQQILSGLNHYGTQVTEANRGLIIAAARRIAKIAVIHSELLKSEMGTFVEQDNGKIEADKGCHDDRVFAYAHACSVVERAQVMTDGQAFAANDDPEPEDPFGWNQLFGDQHKPRGTLPISRERFG